MATQQVVVLLKGTRQNKEIITRARNKLVIVTQRHGAEEIEEMSELLEDARRHGEEESFVCPYLSDSCEFTGIRMLRRVMLGDQVRSVCSSHVMSGEGTDTA